MFLLHNVVNPKEARTIERKKEREREMNKSTRRLVIRREIPRTAASPIYPEASRCVRESERP